MQSTPPQPSDCGLKGSVVAVLELPEEGIVCPCHYHVPSNINIDMRIQQIIFVFLASPGGGGVMGRDSILSGTAGVHGM